MKRRAAAALGLALALAAGEAAAAETAAPSVAYVLDATEIVATGRVRVAMALREPYAAPASVVVPRGYPGGYALVPYDHFFENVRAFSPEGRLISAAPADFGPRWTVGKSGDRIARVEWVVDVARMERDLLSAVESSKVRKGYAGILGYSVFGYVDGLERRPVALSVRAPAGWPVLATLAPAVPPASGEASVRAPDYDTLADSQILLGPDLKVLRLDGAIPLVLAVYAECEEDLALEGALAKTALDRVHAYFGDSPIRQYTVGLELLKPIQGHVYRMSQEHVDSGTFSLSVERATMPATPERARQITLVNYAHHMAHSWIPKRAYGSGYSPHTWEAPPLLDTIWFNEGFGRYAGIQALADGMPPAEGAAFRARALARLKEMLDEAPPFMKRMTLLDLSRAASFLYSTDFRFGMSTFARGALLAADMDDRIRAATGGTKSLKDALRELLKSPQPFRIEDLPRIFRDATGVDVRDLLERALAARAPIP